MKNKEVKNEDYETIEISIKCTEQFAERMGVLIIDRMLKQGHMAALTALTGAQLLTEKRRNDRLN